MTLKEQLIKVENDLEKLEAKKKELQEKKKELLKDIELEEACRKAKENQQVLKVVEDTFGEITDENLEEFRRFMESRRENRDAGV